MNYSQILIYDIDGEFQGYGILKTGTQRLQSVNIWSEAELADFEETLERLNGSVAISQHWPSPMDPEVQALLADPKFHPVPTHMVEVVDEDSSYYVFRVDEDGNDTDELDEDASVIATVMREVPVNQSDVTSRVREAREIIARKRASV